ncbi:cellulose synthase complex outer membrane protein BcsC [Pseudomonas sp. CFII68]|uniref:cellulose synthase complex outer membrane protein BcsC n=1 Tax=Pseudomonas sp. CFII68 TaxID=911243 RepID=UPI0003550A25|nr:cellulose synthase complex outer membrane protein BcsC [Pseudomonas sp. CFII68]EPJ78371.1 cellulose synthase subunit BcsC [Pseudomonas sp. CFII68]
MQKMIGFGLLLSSVYGVALGEPLSPPDQQQWLLEQVRIGEALYREDLVHDSLARLELIAPDNAQVKVVEVRQALLQKNQPEAERLVAQLRQQAPGTAALRQAESLLKMHGADGQRALQEARLLAVAGRFEDAIKAYRQLFGDDMPDFATALEYLNVRSGIKAERPVVIEQLRELDRQYPGNASLRQTLAGLLFAEKRDPEALDVLHQLAGDPNASDNAAEREYNYWLEQPVGPETAQGWRVFLKLYPNTSLRPDATKQLQEQEQYLADPAWQAGVKGKALLEAGNHVGAEASLRRAIKRYPQDSSLLGSLGVSLMRQNRHEAAYHAFIKASSIEQDTFWMTKWQDLKAANHQWMLLQKGDEALERKDYPVAKKWYRQANQAKPNDPAPLIGLSYVAQGESDDITAEALLVRARKLDPSNASTVRAMVRLYQSQSPEKAEHYLDSLTPKEQREFQSVRRELTLDRLNAQADGATRRSDWAQVTVALSKARVLDPDNPWLVYRLANAQRERGLNAEADQSFHWLLQRRGQNADARYAHGLFLANAERDGDAMGTLQQIPRAAWSDNMNALWARLQRRQLLAKARALRDGGHEAQAEALLMRAPTTDDYLTLADWAQQRGDLVQAESRYRKVLTSVPKNTEAQLGLSEVLIASGQPNAAKVSLMAVSAPVPADVSFQRRLANAWASLGDKTRANALFAQLLKTPQSDPLVYRDAARLLSREEPQRALDDYARSMGAARMIEPPQAQPRDNRAMTLASRASDSDDWLKRSIRSDVDELYQKQNPTVNLYHDLAWRTDNSSSGVSDLTTQTTILRIDAPVAQGQGFVQAEDINLDVSNFSSSDRFGLCAVVVNGCTSASQSVRGTQLGMGWHDDRWAFDLGHTPQEFTVSNWVGGVTYSGDWSSLDYRLTASRRPLTNSLVSYAGAVDPVTGTQWGGVTANGFTLGLSHDRGAKDGVWASLSSHWLVGQNVENNQRRTAMGGYYYRLVERADERLRTGLTLMYMGFDKDLSEDTLGQGGYYSPQQYYSVSVPVNYAWRNADWSALLESSVGWSFAKIDGSDFYPKDNREADLQSLLAQSNKTLVDNPSLTKSGSSSNGYNLRVQGLVERRLSDNLVLGAGITWQHSEGYAPSRALLYLRYTFDPWQGNLPLPVEPISPYADMR